jgi:hypothetical protein
MAPSENYIHKKTLGKLFLKMDPKLSMRGTSVEAGGSALRALAPSLRHISAELAPLASVAGTSALGPLTPSHRPRHHRL